jgi:hypothetical protein
MTILTIMGAALFTMFSQSTRAYQRTQARTDQFLAARETLGLIAMELREAIVDPNASPGPGPGAQFYMFDRDNDPDWRTGVHDRSSQIYFVAPTEARPTQANQDVCVVGYWVYDDPNDDKPPTLMRYCLADNESGWNELDPRTERTGLSQECGVNVAQLTFEWWDATQDPPDEAKWDPSNTDTLNWDSSHNTSEPSQLYRLPPAVRITLVVWDPGFDPKANLDDPAVWAEARRTFKIFTTVVRLNNAF